MLRRIKVVDGTTVTMPDTPENQTTFPQQSTQKPGLGFPICRIVAVTCLASGALLNGAFGRYQGKGTDEQSLLRGILDTFEPGDLILGDAFYPTYFLLATLQAQQIDVLMEQQGARQRVTDFRKGKRLAERDHLITLTKPKTRPDWMTKEQYDAVPDSLLIREFKTGGKIMVTTLCHKAYPKSQLKQLYKQRWQVEVDIRFIKQVMGMDILSCKTPEMIRKEIWVYLLAYNLIRLMMNQSAHLADIPPRTISFKHCMQLWLSAIPHAELTPEKLDQLFLLMAQQRVGKRPGRIEPRAVKRRPKAYRLLTIRREEEREKIQQLGHPKKLK